MKNGLHWCPGTITFSNKYNLDMCEKKNYEILQLSESSPERRTRLLLIVLSDHSLETGPDWF